MKLTDDFSIYQFYDTVQNSKPQDIIFDSHYKDSNFRLHKCLGKAEYDHVDSS